MNFPALPKPQLASSVSCTGTGLEDLQDEMRYTQDSTTPALTIDQPSQINLYPAAQPVLGTQASAYGSDGSGTFFSQTPHSLYANSLNNVRPRLDPSTSVTGMALAHRAAQLPHPSQQLSTRDLYSSSTPYSRGRVTDHSARSPPFPAPMRRNPISPTLPVVSFSQGPVKMEGTTYGARTPQPDQNNIPPMGALQTHGTLSLPETHPNGPSPVSVDISGRIEKGFFLADNEWTCYRRNYFSCACSFTMNPHMPGTTLQFHESSTNQVYQVYGFAMSISAVVADNDMHAIELVQHTPKRDKGPQNVPGKVPLGPKLPPSMHHPLSMYGTGDMGLPGPSPRLPYDSGFGHHGAAQQHQQQQQQQQQQTEHNFERIQFKQATANNGKRRAAQQYYHLIVELWANAGSPQSPQWVKVAQRKSEKMIVRGRSPGHYQAERRGSQTSNGGGASGGLGGQFGGHPGGVLPGADGPYASVGASGTYAGYNPTASSYEARSVGLYGSTPRSTRDLAVESALCADEPKGIQEHKVYAYYPSTIYENGHHDPRNPVDMFTHSGPAAGNATGSTGASAQVDHAMTNGRPEHQSHHQSHQNQHQHQPHQHQHPHQRDVNGNSAASIASLTSTASGVEAPPASAGGSLPSLFYPGSSYYNRGTTACGRFEAKTASSGYYPSAVQQPGVNMT